MTEQELQEKFIELSAAQLKEFGVDGSPYIVNRFAVLVWKKLQPSITQYGDTRERLGRIDELVRADCRKNGDVVPGGEVMVHCCKEAIMGHYHCSNWQAKEQRLAALKEEV